MFGWGSALDPRLGELTAPRLLTGWRNNHCPVHESDLRPEALYSLGSGSWLAWANDTAAHYAAIHCPRQPTIHGEHFAVIWSISISWSTSTFYLAPLRLECYCAITAPIISIQSSRTIETRPKYVYHTQNTVHRSSKISAFQHGPKFIVSCYIRLIYFRPRWNVYVRIGCCSSRIRILCILRTLKNFAKF